MPRGGIRPICVIKGCGEPNKAKGLCVNHYANWRRTGDPCTQKRAPNGSGTVFAGYRFIFIRGKQRREHHVVAENMLGRKLRKGEVVHHKDGDSLNNKPENLEVLDSQAEHARMHYRAGEMRINGAPLRKKR